MYISNFKMLLLLFLLLLLSKFIDMRDGAKMLRDKCHEIEFAKRPEMRTAVKRTCVCVCVCVNIILTVTHATQTQAKGFRVKQSARCDRRQHFLIYAPFLL